MKLKILHIEFKPNKQFLNDLALELFEDCFENEYDNSMVFESEYLFDKILTPSRIHILMAIARIKPDSIRKLADIIGRDYSLVHKDCKALAGYGFIHGLNNDGPKSASSLKLKYDYDVIIVHSLLDRVFAISEASMSQIKKLEETVA